MSGLADLAGETVSAVLGTLVGGAITVFVTRWQLTKTIVAQAELASTQQAVDTRLARAERAGAAAQLLLERLADLYNWLPSLPDVFEQEPTLSEDARKQCSLAMESLRRGMHTELLGIGDIEVRERYRTLVRLAYDVGRRGVGRGHRQRQIRDVRGYLRYVQASLESVIDAGPLPGQVEPPVLDRAEDEEWLPPALARHWVDPADGS
ncbi:hypothetical protein [Streptomyces sp. NBC_01262]|uniref:hypothetical protein n=1 Tax=Streptomyces sp. NBC_01262 TaxID=2903803 RepID=UPI002E30DFE8|nr:hypothetical protein [Streptomyces sp. NBC_01262]